MRQFDTGNMNNGWKTRYKLLIEGQTEAEQDQADGERRSNPRLSVNAAGVMVQTSPRFEVIDVSDGGIAFVSDVAFTPGQRILLALEGDITCGALVLACEMEEVDESMLEMRYRVRCRADDEQSGTRLAVLLKEQDTPGGN